MVIITRARGGGKSTQVVDLLKGNADAVAIVVNHNLRQHLYGMGAPKGTVYTIEEVTNGRVLRGRRIGPIIVDDLDQILPALLQIPPHANRDLIATATGVAM